MGCGNSLEATMQENRKSRKKGKKSGKKGKKGARNELDDFNAIITTGKVVENPMAAPSQGSPTTPAKGSSKQSVVAMGKEKFVSSYGALTQEVVDPVVGQGVFLVFVPRDTPDGLSFCFRKADGVLFGHQFSTETQIKHAKDSACIKLGWSAVFKSLNTDVSKGKGTFSMNQNKGIVYTFTVRGGLKGEQGTNAAGQLGETFAISLNRLTVNQDNVRCWFLEPMILRVQTDRQQTDQDNAFAQARLECGTVVTNGNIQTIGKKVEKLEAQVAKSKKKSQSALTAADSTLQKIAQVESKRMKLLSKAGKRTSVVDLGGSKKKGNSKHVLDRIYENGGAQNFVHSEYFEAHYPKEPEYETLLADWLRDSVQHTTAAEEEERVAKESGNDGTWESVLVPPPPIRAMVLSRYPNIDTAKLDKMVGNSEALWRVMRNLERWEYNVFEVEEYTNGNGLFFTCYALLHRLNLVTHFGIDDKILRNFLLAVQSGYHPNAYHNSSHAADVCHILTYIVNWGGLQKVCPLVQEETLAAVLAGAIHDYDHPGCNNNFHTRTNAYLSTLYNDRSILENHHLACVFEMMRVPKFNILGGMDPDSRKEIRDTMVECVLSTDMGIHGKMMMNFQSKVQEGCNWSQKKDNVRLLLSMCTKMADTSNCGRPNNLYCAWAKNIAAEFYEQGDVEQRLKMPVSPFMNRGRHMEDFAKGQSSFISFVIEPMFNSMVEVLPDMEFVLEYSTANKAYWTTHTPEDLGPIVPKREKMKKKASIAESDKESTAPSEVASTVASSEAPSANA